MQPHGRKTTIGEVDVVGATKRLALATPPSSVNQAVLAPRSGGRGRALPRKTAPPGARLLIRERVDNWVVARFALARPERLSINQLDRLAPRFFQRTPKALLVFVQQPRALTPGRTGGSSAHRTVVVAPLV